MIRAAAALLPLVMLLAGCEVTQGRRESWPGQPRPEGPSTQPLTRGKTGEPVPLGSGLPLPTMPEDAPASADAVSGAAVTSLLTQARDSLQAQRPDLAAAALERALRIEPRNPFVWSLLARAHLEKGDADQAESTALRANSLAHGNPYVEVENWRVISEARQSRGDSIGALQAQARSEEMARLIGQQAATPQSP